MREEIPLKKKGIEKQWLILVIAQMMHH